MYRDLCRIITITANYGLGESVVSASAEPDTFKVRRSPTGRVKLDNVIIGKKKSLIEQDESGGTVERDVGAEDSQKVSHNEHPRSMSSLRSLDCGKLVGYSRINYIRSRFTGMHVRKRRREARFDWTPNRIMFHHSS